MADRTSQERNFSMGIPAFPRSLSRRLEHSSIEDLRLISLGHCALFMAILTSLVPRSFALLGMELLSTISTIGLFLSFLVVGWLLVGSFLNVARAAAERLYDGR